MRTDPCSDLLALLSRTANTALFLDIDGTLIDIADSPDLVEIPVSLVSNLKCVSERLDGAVALISGRAIAWIDRAFHPLRIAAAGQHGAEIRLSPEGPVSTIDANLNCARIRVRDLDSIEGIEIEDKGLSIAVHYRRAPDAAALIARALSDLGDAIEMLPGRFVYEVKMRGLSKASAIARLCEASPFRGRIPIFAGDDRTDLDGFNEVLARGGIAIQVGTEIALPGSLSVKSPSDLRRWLTTTFTGVAESECP